MLKIEKTEVVGWGAAIRGMRNPLNSWDKSDSNLLTIIKDEDGYIEDFIGASDLSLMRKLAKGGSSHAKYRRMITVYVDITAPLYWWKEFDTYKVGTVANSCSTMHRIHERPLTMEDFSHEHLTESGLQLMEATIECLNYNRAMFITSKSKHFWNQMIQLLPTSYNQKRTVMLNYEVLAGMYPDRKNHKLDEWHTLCAWIEQLPYSELITGAPQFTTGR